ALRGRGIQVDVAAFNAAMERQRADARAAWQGSGEAATDTVWFAVKEREGATEFLGYDTESAEGVVRALVRDGVEVDVLRAGEQGLLVLNQTPFYGESGGQAGDTGLVAAETVRATVLNTQKKLGDLFVHEVQVAEGELTRGTALTLEVDHARRAAIRANHSATHLLHEALRRVLGDHVAQKGSSVAPERLRFDFSHPKPMSENELAEVEEIVNSYVLRNEPVETRLMAVDDAVQSGARALFGEKYGDEVRVVTMGTDEGNGAPFSVELCGGTHVKRTGDIGLVSVVGESAVASGVRRIEALTATRARHHLNAANTALQAAAASLKVGVADVEARVAALVDERRKLAMGGGGEEGGPAITEVNGTRYLRILMTGADPKDLKAIVDQGKTKIGSGVVAVANMAADGKGALVVGVTADLADRFDAQKLVRTGVETLGGKGGGGRP
ncbi:MAG: alanine--tRNA ligase, partial [Azorhizobium sp. 39-67-5]